MKVGVNCYQEMDRGTIAKIPVRLRKDMNLKLQMHSMIAFYNQDNSQEKKESRNMWQQSLENSSPNIPNMNIGGMLMFGGIDDKKRISDKLWLV